MADDKSIKREFRIDSSDSARPPATLQAETMYYAQGLKPKVRTIVNETYSPLEKFIPASKGQPASRLILKVTTYDDGVEVDTTVGENNPGYQDYLRGITRKAEGTSATRVNRPLQVIKPAAKKG
jgi:hypothetical protein